MTTFSPPPASVPIASAPLAKAPPVAWLVPIAALAAIVGAILPWFQPILYNHGKALSIPESAHSWEAGRIGVLGPVLLVLVGILVFRRLMGKASARARKDGRNPVTRAGFVVVVAVVVTLGLQFLARAVVLKAITVNAGGKSFNLVDYASAAGYSGISRGTQIGFWVTAGAAVVALIGGIAMMIVGRKQASAPVSVDTPAATFNAPAAATV